MDTRRAASPKRQGDTGNTRPVSPGDREKGGGGGTQDGPLVPEIEREGWTQDGPLVPETGRHREHKTR